MNRTPVRSSNIASVGYENGTLEIAFVDGGVYQYFNVPEHVYQGLMSAVPKDVIFTTTSKIDIKQKGGVVVWTNESEFGVKATLQRGRSAHPKNC